MYSTAPRDYTLHITSANGVGVLCFGEKHSVSLGKNRFNVAIKKSRVLFLGRLDIKFHLEYIKRKARQEGYYGPVVIDI